jgi:hypothetical protein
MGALAPQDSSGKSDVALTTTIGCSIVRIVGPGRRRLGRGAGFFRGLPTPP